MLRKDLEILLKDKGIKQVDVLLEGKKLPIYCTLGSTGLKDYTNHMVNRKTNILGYLEWTDGGNCDLILVDRCDDRLPWMRGGLACEKREKIIAENLKTCSRN